MYGGSVVLYRSTGPPSCLVRLVGYLGKMTRRGLRESLRGDTASVDFILTGSQGPSVWVPAKRPGYVLPVLRRRGK